MFPVAFGVAASTRVGTLLGAGNPDGAEFATNINVVLTALVSAALGLSLWMTPHSLLPSLFAPNEPAIVWETSRTIPQLAIYVFADGIQGALSGVIKGCGRQMITMPIVVFAYWLVAIPTAYYLAFQKHGGVMVCEEHELCGDVALVAGMTAGTWVHMLLLAVVVGGTTNWVIEARKAKERIMQKQ